MFVELVRQPIQIEQGRVRGAVYMQNDPSADSWVPVVENPSSPDPLAVRQATPDAEFVTPLAEFSSTNIELPRFLSYTPPPVSMHKLGLIGDLVVFQSRIGVISIPSFYGDPEHNIPATTDRKSTRL